MIDLDQPLTNEVRRFGSASMYYGATVSSGGKRIPALFTRDQVDEAIRRAELNPEDAPDVRPWWRRLLGL